MTLNKTDLEDWQQKVDDLSKWKAELKDREEKFKIENEGLIKNITALNETVMQTKTEFCGFALEEYKKTGNTKLLGGLGIRVYKDLIYDDTLAIQWAEKHNLCMVLDKRAFEKIVSSQSKDRDDLKFVTIKDRETVTFPGKGIHFS